MASDRRHDDLTVISSKLGYMDCRKLAMSAFVTKCYLCRNSGPRYPLVDVW